jgi:hypothetical protein
MCHHLTQAERERLRELEREAAEGTDDPIDEASTEEPEPEPELETVPTPSD